VSGARAALVVTMLAVMVGAPAPGGALAWDWAPWSSAYDAATGTRFIPVELFTGGEWNGARVIRLAPAERYFGTRRQKSLRGPIEWIRPETGERLLVYERMNAGKRQLFALSRDGTGLGRVWDSRYAEQCVDEVKFPLGDWKQAEVRTYQISCGGGKRLRPLKVTIRDVDFLYDGVPHSLRFHWLLDEGRGRGTDMTYVYSPGRGLVDVRGNE
jgi:hypothetical protein